MAVHRRLWDRYVRPGWTGVPAGARILLVGSVLASLLAVAIQLTGLGSTGTQRLWADNLAWTVAGIAALCGSLAAALTVKGGQGIRPAWLWYAAASACWIVGALVRITVAGRAPNTLAASCWVACAVCGLVSFARRLPRLYIYAIFLLDAIPVILLAVAIVRTVEPPPATMSADRAVFLLLYPGVFGLLAAHAVQMTDLHLQVRKVPPAIWLFTAGFCAMALAALLWTPVVVRSGVAQGHTAGALWTLGLLGVGASGVARALQPTESLRLPKVEQQRGPHALPPAAAVLGLIIMLAISPASGRLLILVFLLTAALDLFVRVTLLRREDVHLLARLASQNERLLELDRMKDEFVALVSHELRTPLTAIAGYLELFESAGPLTAQQREFTGIIHRNTDRLLRLIGDLLFLSRVQAGQLRVEFGETDLLEVVELSIQAARPAADSKDITLSLSAAPVPHLMADRMRLSQLVDNLVSNAIKFTPQGGRITIATGTEDQSAVLDVTDTGLGISAAECEHVFDRFFRAQNAICQAVQGTGLGLTITKAIVDAHGGTISLSSQLDQGTTFRVRLPTRQAANAAASDVHPAPSANLPRTDALHER
jgi:signal transduction histidine kinase